MLRKHLSILRSGEKKAEELFNSIVSLKVGEALVFASSALLGLALPAAVDGAGFAITGYPDSELEQAVTAIKKMNSEPFRVNIRRRITADGGESVMSLGV